MSTRQICCPHCGGCGTFQISHEMATDAGDEELCGQEWNCSECNGDGWILVENEPGPELPI